jgi:hypothetical protein
MAGRIPSVSSSAVGSLTAGAGAGAAVAVRSGSTASSAVPFAGWAPLAGSAGRSDSGSSSPICTTDTMRWSRSMS